MSFTRANFGGRNRRAARGIDNMRTWYAVGLGPLAIPLLMAIVVVFDSLLKTPPQAGGDAADVAKFVVMGLGGILLIGTVMWFYAAMGTLIIGLPFHLLMLWLGVYGRIWYALAGIAGGYVVAMAIPGGSSAFAKITDSGGVVAAWNALYPLGLCIVLGGPVTALAFWQVARPDRPDTLDQITS